MSLTNCRFYEEKFPEIDSFVMVNVKQVRQATTAERAGKPDDTTQRRASRESKEIRHGEYMLTGLSQL